jgi:hypothetical protein
LKSKTLSLEQRKALLRALSRTAKASITSLQALISKRRIPARLSWRPDICIRLANTSVLVHLLVSSEFPSYLETALAQLKNSRFKNTYVLLLARDIATEGGDETPSGRIAAPLVALNVAEKAMSLGCALAFESEGRVYLVFDKGYQPPARVTCEEETGHIPTWLYSALARAPAFSDYVSKAFKSFANKYGHATNRTSITNNREADLLLTLAKRLADGDRRLYFPIENLVLLKQYESGKSNIRTRDHFFHTFNNLLLGFYILGTLYRKQKYISEIDRYIEDSKGVAKSFPWESLWFLVCAFHDPAYIAEKFWGTFRFSYGVQQEDPSEDEELPDQVKEKIRDMWDSKFLAPRQDLHDLYHRVQRLWTPPSLRRPNTECFDKVIHKAYFDGRNTSHSLVSGFRLISLCRSNDVPMPQ